MLLHKCTSKKGLIPHKIVDRLRMMLDGKPHQTQVKQHICAVFCLFGSYSKGM